MNPQPVGERIRSILKAAGRTQASLAETAGLKSYEISRTCSGKRAATLQTLELIAQGLEISLLDLVQGTDAEHFLAPENQHVTRSHHEHVLAKLADAQSQAHEETAARQAADRRVAELSQRLVALEAERDSAVMAREEADHAVAIRTTALTRMEGQLLESREHVFQLEQTVQGQSARREALESASRELAAGLSATQGQYASLHSSYEQLRSSYTDLWRKHSVKTTKPTPSAPDPGPAILAGIVGLVIGGAVASRS